MDFSKSDLDTIAKDVTALKRDLAKTLDRLKDTAFDGALERARDVVEDMGDDVEGFYKDFAKRGRRTAKSIGGHIEDQPITSMLIAFSVGYVMSKLISR